MLFYKWCLDMWDKNKEVHIYMGGYNLIEKSGVGRAILHQKELLQHAGVKVNNKNLLKSNIIQYNTILPDSALSAIIMKILGKKIVYYGHSTMEDFKNSFKGSNLFAPLFKLWIKFCYNLGDVIITPTPYSKKLLLSYGIKKPIVDISNGINAYFWESNNYIRDNVTLKNIFCIKNAIPKNKKIIMSVGHMIERKGIVEFLEVAKRNPEYVFIWFGYTNINLIPANVSVEIKNASENVIFPGYVDKEELRKAYQFCDLFLFMSHEETEGIVVLEALSSKIPTIVRDIPVYENWLENDVNIYKFKDEKELDLMIQYVLEVKNDLILENGYNTAMERDFKNIAKKLCKVYEEYL